MSGVERSGELTSIYTKLMSRFLIAEKDVFARREEFERSVSESNSGSINIRIIVGTSKSITINPASKF